MMEKCQGNLENLIKGQIKGIEKNSIECRSILGQLAVGLSYLHGKEIIHRNLKPSNVLIRVSFDFVVIKLTDIGFSRKLPEENKSFNTIGNFETPIYRAPELHHSLNKGQTGKHVEILNAPHFSVQ